MIDHYTALAHVLHTDWETARRWFFAWAYGAGDRRLFNILQGD